MADEWIIRVDGKEYGPADVAMLREWKAEGRLLSTNDVRPAEADIWTTAATIPGLFDAERPPVQRSLPPSLPTAVSNRSILPETFVIYTRGFFKYFGLTLLVVAPSIAAQLAGEFMRAPGSGTDTRTLLAGTFALSMLLLSLILTPIYIAGIQILTAAFAAGERIGFFATLNEAVKYWPRVAFLWIFVFLCYAFWTVMPVAVMLTIILSGPSALSIFLVLVILTVMVWVTGRLFVNFMFWQQFAVLEGCNALEALRRSRELARSANDLRWFRRPMWRGVFIASLWFVVVLALNWPIVSQSFQTALAMPHDPQAAMEAFRTTARGSSAAGSTFAANVLQAILKPLLGIAFVLLFLDTNMAAGEEK